MAVAGMRGLTVFVQDVRNCANKVSSVTWGLAETPE